MPISTIMNLSDIVLNNIKILLDEILKYMLCSVILAFSFLMIIIVIKHVWDLLSFENSVLNKMTRIIISFPIILSVSTGTTKAEWTFRESRPIDRCFEELYPTRG